MCVAGDNGSIRDTRQEEHDKCSRKRLLQVAATRRAALATKEGLKLGWQQH